MTRSATILFTRLALSAVGFLGVGCAEAGAGLEGHAAQAAKCGNAPLGEMVLGRPSSFRSCPTGDDGRGICDPEEACDYTHFDLLCVPGPCEPPMQDGDLRCHRICRDGMCASGEICVERPVYVSDTPTRFEPMCLCEADDCVERDAEPEGGLESWVRQADLPKNLFYHSATSTDSLMYVSGGLSRFEEDGTLFNSEEVLVYGARLAEDGEIAEWFNAGELPMHLNHHESTVANDRLYVLGGEQRGTLASGVYSARILDDGTLGPWRSEAPLPMARSYHVALVADSRMFIVGGRSDRLSSGIDTEDGWVGSLGEDGELLEWTSFSVPTNPYYNRATVAVDRLYIVGDTREDYPDVAAELSSAKLPLDDDGWEFRAEPAPEGANRAYSLSATREVSLVGSCDALVSMLPGGKAMTAGLDAEGSVGAWRVASGIPETAGTGFAVTATPEGNLYLLGGAGSAKVWHTRRER